MKTIKPKKIVISFANFPYFIILSVSLSANTYCIINEHFGGLVISIFILFNIIFGITNIFMFLHEI